MAEDLLALLDALGVERAHLLGLSLGGAIAQEAVLAAPARFASLQLHATWAGPHPYFHALVGAVRAARLQLDREGFYRALSVWLFTPACFASQPELVEMVVQRRRTTRTRRRSTPISARPRPPSATTRGTAST